MLRDDAKNYHVWEHRQALVASFRLWQQELQYVDSQLQLDVRNNSAWNQRMFLLAGMAARTDVAAHPNVAAQAGVTAQADVAAGVDVDCLETARRSDERLVAAPSSDGAAPSTDGAAPSAGTISGVEPHPVAPGSPGGFGNEAEQRAMRGAQGGSRGVWLEEATFETELAVVTPMLLRVPHNEAAWNYLTGLLHARADWSAALARDARVQDLCEQVCVCAWVGGGGWGPRLGVV